jgi:hypothetical protein
VCARAKLAVLSSCAWCVCVCVCVRESARAKLAVLSSCIHMLVVSERESVACVCVCVCARVCARECVRAGGRAGGRACGRAWRGMCVNDSMCVQDRQVIQDLAYQNHGQRRQGKWVSFPVPFLSLSSAIPFPLKCHSYPSQVPFLSLSSAIPFPLKCHSFPLSG